MHFFPSISYQSRINSNGIKSYGSSREIERGKKKRNQFTHFFCELIGKNSIALWFWRQLNAKHFVTQLKMASTSGCYDEQATVPIVFLCAHHFFISSMVVISLKTKRWPQKKKERRPIPFNEFLVQIV